MKIINEIHLDKSSNYNEYKKIILNLFEQGKTTGSDQSPEMIEYTKMNIHRMNRLEKTVVLRDDLIETANKVSKRFYWVCLTEAWCGDAAQILPVLNKINELNSNLDLRILFRDENPEVINDNLTNGTKSIPKLIILDSDLNKIHTWGPRPNKLAEFVSEFKKKENFDKKEMIKEIQIWYNKDNTQEIQLELIEIIKKIV